ncbi:GMC oxidoreductase [Panus rudis PR-1116 ss-1]|nr:GMC oxidoreductase [Panus rudis PR-1116 ss-1]
MPFFFWKSSPYVSDPSRFATPVSSSDTDGDYSKYKEYDYVVVGGGTAGCVVAARLSEDPNAKVLLIEAGKSEGPLLTRSPLAFTKSYKTDVDWAYLSIPQKNLHDKQIYWARGKVLGGTSVLNALIYDRCFPDDYDSWAKAGNDGWSWQELEPYFRKAERYSSSGSSSSLKLDEKGRDGPWHLKKTELPAKITETWIDTCKAVGIPVHEDINASGSAPGVGVLHGFITEKGERNHTAAAYLTPDVLARPNLTVAVTTTVEKILFSGEDDSLRAAAVEVSSGPKSPKYRVQAKKEVVLCGGVFSSPHILLVSGVGPKDELEAAGVKCVKDLPAVGKHMVDHMSSGLISFRAKPGVTMDYLLSQPLSAALALIKWLWSGKGPFSMMAVNSAAYVRSDDEKLIDTSIGPCKNLTSGPNAPDLEFMFTPAIAPDYWTVPKSGDNGITTASVLLKPESEGSVKIKSGSIWDRPEIDGNYLSSESDINVILRGLRLILKILKTEPLNSQLDLRPLNPAKDGYFVFGDKEFDKLTDDDLRKFIIENGQPACHPAGTCRMGTDPTDAVVDPKLQVHGIKGLRIVDASVFPTQVSGHPVAPIVAMSEKLCDLIKAEHSTK